MNRKQGRAIQYEFWAPMASLRNPKIVGITAPPAMAITKRDEPAFVNLPKSAMANGQRAGHIKEQPRAIRPMNQIEIPAGVKTTSNDPNIPKMEHITNALAWLRYFGIKIIPQIYPITIPTDEIQA